MDEGLLDTNVVIHSLRNDDHSQECLRFMQGLKLGTIRAELHPLVVHELTYIFRRFGLSWDCQAIAGYVRQILAWPGIVGDVRTLDRALARWGNNPGLGFVDAYLIKIALPDGCQVYTINVRDFAPYGVSVPQPLPSGA